MLCPKRKIRLLSLILSTGFLINNFCAFATSPEKAGFFNPNTHDPLHTLPTPEKPNPIRRVKKSESTSPIFKTFLSPQRSSIYPYVSPRVYSNFAPIKMEAVKTIDEATDRKIDKITSLIVERLDCNEPEYIRDYTKRLLLHVYKNHEASEEIILIAAIYWNRIDSDFLFNILRRDEKSYAYTMASLLCIADKFAGSDTYFPTARYWSKMCNTDLDKVIEYERDLCIHFNFNLSIPTEEYQLYETLLA